MSKRNRSSTQVDRAPKRERRWTTHQERRAVRASLDSVSDPEEILVPEVTHHGPHLAEPDPKARPRHWKLKDWKRRTAQRRARVLAAQRLAKSP